MNFNRDSLQTNFKSISSYSFWDGGLKLGSYVLGTETKLSMDQMFDLDPMSENIEFKNFKISIFDGGHFKFRYFHFWNINKKSGRLKV